MDPKIIDKALSKKASEEEARSVAAWFATTEGQAYFSQRFDRESYLLNEALLQEWLEGDIPSKQMRTRFFAQFKYRVRTFRFRLVAAVLIPFIVFLGAFTFLVNRSSIFQSSEMAEFVVPYGELLNIVLQDGTKVQLNSGSRLEYPKSFGMFNRKVKLSGEAYFSVAKESSRAFEVDLNDIKVKVTGTQFNVKAYDEDNIIRVALEEGSVSIADKKNNHYPLKVGQVADYDKQTGECKVVDMAEMGLHTAWRTKSLNFYRTPLKDILKTLERQYEVRFEVPDSTLLNYRFSISTSKINLQEVLYDLEKVSKIRFIINNADETYRVSMLN